MKKSRHLYLQSRSTVTFEDCLAACLHDRDYVVGFDRLYGTRIEALRGHNLLFMVLDDDARFGGDQEARRATKKFVSFVHNTVWLRLDPSVRAETPLTPAVRKLLEEP